MPSFPAFIAITLWIMALLAISYTGLKILIAAIEVIQIIIEKYKEKKK